MSVLIDAKNNSQAEQRVVNLDRLSTVLLPDGSRIDAREMVTDQSAEFNERMLLKTDLRHGSSNTLREMERLARQRPQDRTLADESKGGIGAKRFKELLTSDAAAEVDSKVESDKSNRTKFPALRAIASYLVDGMSLFKSGAKLWIIKEGSEEDNKGRNEQLTIVVNEGTFNEYRRLLGVEPNETLPLSSVGFVINKGVNQELLSKFLSDKFGISRNNNIRILKENGNNSSEGMFYWHDGYLKVDSKIKENTESGLSRLDGLRAFLRQMVLFRRKEANIKQTQTINQQSVNENDIDTPGKKEVLGLDRDKAYIGNNLLKPLDEYDTLQREIDGRVVDLRNKASGYQLNELAKSGAVKMIGDEVLLRVLRHIYSKDFRDIIHGPIDELTIRSAEVLDVLGRILATQEIARVVFEYTLGAVDIVHTSKLVSSEIAEKRFKMVKGLIDEYEEQFATAETHFTQTKVRIPDSLASKRVDALRDLLGASWEIMTVNNTLNKESGDWEEAAKEISGIVRDDTHSQAKLYPNIQTIYHSINALNLPGLSGDSVMENYYWDLGYRVVAQGEGKKFRLVPRTAKFRDRKGILREYQVSTNYNLLRNCVGYYNGREVDSMGKLQAARSLLQGGASTYQQLTNEELDGFLPENLDKESIDRETARLLPLVNSFSASSTQSLIGYCAGIAICTFDGVGRMRDTGEDIFANDLASSESQYAKYTRQGHGGISNFNTLRGWKRLVEVFQPGMGFIWGSQVFFDEETNGDLAIGKNRTGRRLVPVDSLDKEGTFLYRDVFVPSGFKYYAYDRDGNFCIQTFNKDFATRINVVTGALAKANTRIFGPLEDGFDGFHAIMNERDTTIPSASGYQRLPANLVHKAFLGKLMDAALTSAKEPSIVGDTEERDGKMDDKVAKFLKLVQSTSTLDKLFKALGSDSNALANLVAILPTFAEANVIADIATATNVARSTTEDAVVAPSTVYRQLLQGPLAKGDVFIGPVFSTIIDAATLFPSIISDGTGTTLQLGSSRKIQTVESKLIEDKNGETRISDTPELVTHDDIQIDFGSGYKAAIEVITKPESGVIDVNRYLFLGGLLAYLQWFNSSFRARTENFNFANDANINEGKSPSERKGRLISIRKALNEAIFTFSLFANRYRHAPDSDTDVKDFGHPRSRFVRDFLGYSLTGFNDSEELSYIQFIEDKLREMLNRSLDCVSSDLKARVRTDLKNIDTPFFTENGVEGSFAKAIKDHQPLGEVTGIATIDEVWEAALNNCIVSFQAIGIAERLQIIIDNNFKVHVFDAIRNNNPNFMHALQLEESIEALVKENKISKVTKPDTSKLLNKKEVDEAMEEFGKAKTRQINSVERAIEYLASTSMFGALIEANARITADAFNVQTESKPATRDILGHIATRVERMSTGDVWGRFVNVTIPILDDKNETGSKDYTTSPGLLFLGRLAERDSSIRDAYKAISNNLNLALLEDGQLMDGFGRQLNSNQRQFYPSNVFTPSSLRIKLMTDPEALPENPIDVKSPEYLEFLNDQFMKETWFKDYSKEQRMSLVAEYADFLYEVALEPAKLMTAGQPVRMGPIIPRIEAGFATLLDLTPFYPAARAVILHGELPVTSEVLSTEAMYSAINTEVEGTVDKIPRKILEDVGKNHNKEVALYGLDSKFGAIKLAVEWLMLGTRSIHRELSVFGRNNKLIRLWSGKQDPVNFAQRKKAIEEARTKTTEALKQVNILGFLSSLPNFISIPIKTLGLSIEDFGLKNVIAHGAVGAALAVPTATALAGVVIATVPVLSVITYAAFGIAFATIGGELTKRIDRSLANRDTKTTNLAQGGPFSFLNSVFGSSVSGKKDIWSSIEVKLDNTQKARTIYEDYDWDKGIPKGNKKIISTLVLALDTILPEIPVLGPLLKVFGDSNNYGNRIAKLAVSTVVTAGLGFAVAGPVGLGIGGFIGLMSIFKNVRNYDNTLALVVSDLPNVHETVSGKKVNSVFLSLLNIQEKKD